MSLPLQRQLPPGNEADVETIEVRKQSKMKGNDQRFGRKRSARAEEEVKMKEDKKEK
jgi:hypothetical protein